MKGLESAPPGIVPFAVPGASPLFVFWVTAFLNKGLLVKGEAPKLVGYVLRAVAELASLYDLVLEKLEEWPICEVCEVGRSAERLVRGLNGFC